MAFLLTNSQNTPGGLNAPKASLKARLCKSAFFPLKSALIALVALSAGAFAATAYAADFTVQIGAFGIQPNPAFTEEAAEYGEVLVLQGDDGITRVSIGRYPTRSQARDALARLQIAGYTDAYVANVRGRGVSTATVTAPVTRPVTPAITQPAQTTRTITNTPTASSQRLPSGQQIVTPKRPATSQSEDTITQAGRFRLRTHDTQSGETTDVRLGQTGTAQPSSGPAIASGTRISDIPEHLREKLVYLDGVPHIKDGDQFIPLTDAVDGK